MFKTLPDTRWQAFLIHLGLSLGILAALLFVLIFWWFPGLFIHFGGWHGITIVSGVDVVLGPLLTLIVYNKAKKSLKIDLAVIGCIQLSCLAGGVWAVHQERPMYQALFKDTIEVIPYQDAKHKANLDQIPMDAEVLDQRTPRIVFVDLPETEEQFQAVKTISEFTEGINLAARVDLYKSLTKPETIEAAKKRLAGFEYDQTKECYLLPIKSPHINDKTACFSLSSGVVYLK